MQQPITLDSPAPLALGVVPLPAHDVAPVVVRTMLGIVIFPHGAQKAFGWFGGPGLSGIIDYFAQSLNLPLAIALGTVALELLGPVALVAGFATRAAAAGIGAIMLGAIAFVHAPHGFFMNWFGVQGGEGYEYHLLVLAMAASLVITGGGRWSLDGLLRKAR